MTQRIQRHPFLAIFDGADPAASTPARLTSTTPLQALFFLNDELVHEQAAGLARRLAVADPETPARIRQAYRLTFGRLPDAVELAAAERFLAAFPGPAGDETAAWTALARALFRLNEFVYVD